MYQGNRRKTTSDSLEQRQVFGDRIEYYGGVKSMKNRTMEKDDCCMTATKNSGVFVVAKPKQGAAQAKISGERIAQAVNSTAAYRKKKV